MAKELLGRRCRRRGGVCFVALPVIYFLSLNFRDNMNLVSQTTFQDSNSAFNQPRRTMVEETNAVQLQQQQQVPKYDHRLRSVNVTSVMFVRKPVTTKVSTTAAAATLQQNNTAPKTSHATTIAINTVHNSTDGVSNDSASASTKNKGDDSSSSEHTKKLLLLNATNKIELIGRHLTPLEEYRKNRTYSESWFRGKNLLRPNADEDGPILDFAIVGFPKCGTTTMMANLGNLAPMPVGTDVCTPLVPILWYTYHNWPERFGEDKIMRGTKCPRSIDQKQVKILDHLSNYLPKTKLIIGIRHPFKWFQSFWYMQAGSKRLMPSPYNYTTLCEGDFCRGVCPRGQLFCLHRARFHLSLAALGKTQLSKQERMLLAPEDPDGGDNIKSKQIKNPVFLYEQEELSQDYLWEDLAKYLEVSHIPHEKYHGSHGRKNKIHIVDFCSDEHDAFRAMIMPYAHDLAVWMQEYFIPLAKDESRADVVIPRPDRMAELVEAYKTDPCGKLVRFDNGIYGLPQHNSTSAGKGEMLVSSL